MNGHEWFFVVENIGKFTEKASCTLVQAHCVEPGAGAEELDHL